MAKGSEELDLQQANRRLKVQVNCLQDENLRLKTRIQQMTDQLAHQERDMEEAVKQSLKYSHPRKTRLKEGFLVM